MVMMEVRGMPMTLAAVRIMMTMRTSLRVLMINVCSEGSNLDRVLLFFSILTSQLVKNRPTTRIMIPKRRLIPAVMKNFFMFS